MAVTGVIVILLVGSRLGAIDMVVELPSEVGVTVVLLDGS